MPTYAKPASFCPETTLFRNLGVNPLICLCGVKYYACAQMLDFLDLAKNCWFPNQKRTLCPSEFPDGSQLVPAASHSELGPGASAADDLPETWEYTSVYDAATTSWTASCKAENTIKFI